MKPLRLRHRLLLITVVPLALFAGAYAAWSLAIGHPPGPGGHAAAAAIALLAALGLAASLERTLARRYEWLASRVRRIRAGELERVGGDWAEPVVERLAGEIDALAEEIDLRQRGLQDRMNDATLELQNTLAQLEARNAELEAARVDAEAASEFKSRFLAHISHEIRTPMNSILGFTELLDESALDPVQLDYLTTIRSSAQSLLSLLNGILDLSKIESGHIELEYTDTDVNELLFETYHLFAPQAFAQGVELYVTPLPATDARVRVDPTRLKQVLVNLASNAVKFTDAGYVRIAAAATPRSSADTMALEFSFTDTGRGIPADAQSRLFQAFAQGQQCGADLRAQPAGTGLGLHIASELVFLMDGLIEFRSEPDAGSEFWFHLEVPRAPATGSPEPPRPDRHALLVTRDATAAAAEACLLQRAGIQTEICTDTEAALAHLDGHTETVAEALLVHVPAADAIADEPPARDDRLATAGLPVLAHAYTQSPERRRALLDAGYDDVIDRVPEPDALRTAFERAVDGPDREGSASAVRAQPDAALSRGEALDVLVVDDQPLNLKLLESYLEGTPYRATAARGSDEALQRARLQCFRAILLDIHLPDRDGIETARLLREPGALNADTPVIAVTADAFAERARAALGAGMNDVLIKPVGRGELLECLAVQCAPVTQQRRDATACAVAEPGAGEPPEPPLYDPQDGSERAGGREELADELFAMLLRHLPESRAELRAAEAAGDRESLRAAAHRLKGAAAYCGVPRLRQDLEAIEQAIDEGSEAGPALERALAAIEALETLKSPPSERLSLADVTG